MTLQQLELRLEKLVEGFFARTFRSGVQPVEIARRVLRALQTQRSTDASGNRVGPNHFTIWLSPEDKEQLEPISDSLSNELASEVLERAAADGIRLLGQPRFGWELDENLRQGVFEVVSEVVEGPASTPFTQLVFADGDTHVLSGVEGAPLQAGIGSCAIGRHATNDIVIDDSNVSRHHASLTLTELGQFILKDLESLNGTRVNGGRISQTEVNPGDQLTFGSVVATFQR